MPTIFDILLPAAGSGTRFGGGDKLLTELHGKSVLQRAVGLFAGREDVVRVMIITSPDRFESYREHLGGVIASEKLLFAAGGRERWESVFLGLKALKILENPAEFVGIHDAARPLTPAAVIDAAFTAAVTVGGAVPCVAEPATLKRRAEDGTVAETVDRRGLFQAQTPQCFNAARLLTAYEQLLLGNRVAELTDDAQVFERMRWKVAITAGAVRNLKITTAEDVALARALLAAGDGA